jgi:hypothetical protein
MRDNETNSQRESKLFIRVVVQLVRNVDYGESIIKTSQREVEVQRESDWRFVDGEVESSLNSSKKVLNGGKA